MTPQRIADIVCVAGAAAFVIGDGWREEKDIEAGRDHLTGTTWSSFNRRVVHALPHGRKLWAAACVVAPLWYWHHIDAHLDHKETP